MLERVKNAIKSKPAGEILLVLGLVLLFYPLMQNYYHQWLYPANPVPQSADPQININTPNAKDKFLPIGGRMIIPALDLDLEIGYGTSEEVLRKGPGFYPQSGHPDTGNVSIAGHRNVHGSPFRNLDGLKAGDVIEMHYDKNKYFYEVEKVFVVDENDWSVIDPVNEPALTLTTCHPVYPVNGKYDRLIVRALQTNKVPHEQQ